MKTISRTTWRYLWAVPLGVIFVVLETLAIRNGVPGDTLSEYVWALPWVLRGGIVVLCGWLTAHFLTGGKV